MTAPAEPAPTTIISAIIRVPRRSVRSRRLDRLHGLFQLRFVFQAALVPTAPPALPVEHLQVPERPAVAVGLGPVEQRDLLFAALRRPELVRDPERGRAPRPNSLVLEQILRLLCCARAAPGRDQLVEDVSPHRPHLAAD